MKKWQTIGLDLLVNALSSWWKGRKDKQQKQTQEKDNVDKTP